METLEAERLGLLGLSPSKNHGLIIPLVFRGGEKIAVLIEDENDRLSLTRSYLSFINLLLSSSNAWEVVEDTLEEKLDLQEAIAKLVELAQRVDTTAAKEGKPPPNALQELQATLAEIEKKLDFPKYSEKD